MAHTSRYLSFAGSLPFILCMVAIAFGVDLLPIVGEITHVLGTYGLLIVSFMAGCHWGQHLDAMPNWKHKLPILSNLVTLGAWFGFLVLPVQHFLVLLTITFLVLLFIDFKLFQYNIIEKAYFQTRWQVTTIVVISLCLSIILI